MKVLVVSDVHGEKKRLEDILKTHEDADFVISLGDSELKQKFLQDKDIIAIKGNYPFDKGFAYEHIMTVDGISTLLVHGHRHKVRTGLSKLYHDMVSKNTTLALFGHTHQMTFEHCHGRFLLNPGSVAQSRGMETESYLTMNITNEAIFLTWHDARLHHSIGDAKIDRKTMKDA
ncbi:MAG: metallophosphoesterase family protein [Bacillota bacterium]